MLSLRSFHVVFIVASILMALWVGAWGVQRYLEIGSQEGLATGVVFFLCGFVLLIYGIRFFGKLRSLE